VDAAGDNASLFVPEGNLACTPDDIDAAREVFASADLLLCQLEIALPAVVRAGDLAGEVGLPVILNPAPAQAVPEELFSKAMVLTPNETEAEFFSGMTLPARTTGECADDAWEAEASARLLRMGPQTVVITLGQRGACLATADARRIIPACRITAVDVTAAGDAFNGALAVALAEGRDLEQAVRFANAAGALAATRSGAQPSLATRRELEEFLCGVVAAS